MHPIGMHSCFQDSNNYIVRPPVFYGPIFTTVKVALQSKFHYISVYLWIIKLHVTYIHYRFGTARSYSSKYSSISVFTNLMYLLLYFFNSLNLERSPSEVWSFRVTTKFSIFHVLLWLESNRVNCNQNSPFTHLNGQLLARCKLERSNPKQGC